MEIFGIAIVALCAVILSALLKKVSSEQGILLSIAAVVLILLFVLENAIPFISQIKDMMESDLLDSTYLAILIKAIGITIIGQVTESICMDCGESALAYGVNIASKAAILMLSLPIISKIFEYLSDILNVV